MSASRVKQGSVYVEIGADPRKFFKAVDAVQKRIGSMGRAIAGAGAGLAGVGLGLAAPFVASVRAGARFQDTLLNIQAATNATAGQLEAVRAASMNMSAALGIGPAEAAAGFLELLKAGMSLGDVLGGAGQTALEFAKVGQIDVAQAAVVMSDAMNVFGVSAEVAANSISSAADASSTSIAQMAESFAMSSAVAALANQSIGDLSAALAILANNGVKGSDAGTSIKTMMLRLMAPVDEAVDALDELGLSVASFRDADGQMLPMVEIIRKLNAAMAGMGQGVRDDVFRRIFGQDAIRAAAILTAAGVEGFEEMQRSMADALPVGVKFKQLMSGLSGGGMKVLAALERLAIAITDAVAPAIMSVVPALVGFANAVAAMVQNNPAAVALIAKLGAAAVTVGGSLVGLGMSLRLTAFGLGGLAAVAKIAVAPLGLVAQAGAGVVAAVAAMVPGVVSMGSAFANGLAAAIAFAVQSAAASGRYVSSLAAMAAATGARMGFVAATWAATGLAIAAGFIAHFKAMITYYTGALAGIQAVTIARTGAMAAAWLASIGGVDTFANSIKTTLSMANRVVSSTVGAVAPAIGVIAGGFASLAAAIASDLAPAVARAGAAFAPLVASVNRGAAAVAGFAAEGASYLMHYTRLVGAAAASTVAGMYRSTAAFVGAKTAGVAAFASESAAHLAHYSRLVAAAVGSTVAGAGRIVGAWIATAMPATAAFVSQSVSSLAGYIARTVAAAAATVTNAAAIGVAWLTSGMPGLMGFVTAAVGGLGSYVASVVGAAAATVASMATAAAAFLAPAVPVLALGAAIAGVAAVAYSLRDSLGSAFGAIGGMISSAGSAIGGTFSDAVASASVVLSDLWGTATTTFSGIYEAIANGDLSGAMDILWLGLQAGWARGVEALMGTVDPWISLMQNTFSYLAANVLTIWDGMLSQMSAAWDRMESGVRKGWNFLNAAFQGADQTALNDVAIDREMRQREEERNGKPKRDRMAEADAAAAQREEENRTRADQRRKDSQAANDNLSAATSGKREQRVQNDQYTTLLKDIEGANSLDQLRDLYQEFDALQQNGRLTDGQVQSLESALEDAQNRVTLDESARHSARAMRSAAGAAGGDAAASKSESVGTFSAMSVSGMGYGSSLAERTAKAAEDTARNTAKLVEREGAAVGE